MPLSSTFRGLEDYVLGRLVDDGEYLVVRGRHRRDGSSILALSPVSEVPPPGAVQRFEHTYSLRHELDPAWAAPALGLVRTGGRMWLVLHDPGQTMLSSLLGAPMDGGLFLRIARGLARSIEQVHARGFIHRDIKPSGIMVDPTTGQAWIGAFGVSIRAPRHRTSTTNDTLHGTLAYMAPEQTGRMNRTIDARSDLYSLGCVLHEMLTGERPFDTSVVSELLHAHAARVPAPADLRIPGTPRVLAAIVAKLLQKNAEDRYQTAGGLLRDLDRCAEAHAGGSLETMELALGIDDVSERLVLPETLHGRAGELATLDRALTEAETARRPVVVHLSGASGTGKSVLVHELARTASANAIFLTAKFDPQRRDIPYGAIEPLVRPLVRRILSGDDASLRQWRVRVRLALGASARPIVELVPELEAVLGELPPANEIGPHELAFAFARALRSFLALFEGTILVLFLDDVQWADHASLELLAGLTEEAEPRRLVVLAWRENELASAFRARLEANPPAHAIRLGPLVRADLERLLVEALRLRPDDVGPLAAILHEKTGGNPFFALQFLTTLAESRLVVFDHASGRWRWDLERIENERFTDNLLDLMLARIGGLGAPTRRVLQALACLAVTAHVDTLALIEPEATTASAVDELLRPALLAGLVSRTDARYAFLHDRIHEAVYATVSEAERPALHLAHGRRLRDRCPASARDELVFDVVNQLNRGRGLITEPAERLGLIRLELEAAARARSSAAYTAARHHVEIAAELLASVQDGDRDLAFEVLARRAEHAHLVGEHEEAQRHVARALLAARTAPERARLTGVRIGICLARDDQPGAVAAGLGYLATVGIVWDAHPPATEIERELDRVTERIAGRAIDALVDLPLMTDPDTLATMQVLVEMAAAAVFTDPVLYLLVVARQVSLAIEHGNEDGACLAYVLLGMFLGSHLGRYDEGEAFGRLGCDVVDRQGLARFEGRAFMLHGHQIMAWGDHDLRACRVVIERGMRATLATGDLVWAGYNLNQLLTSSIALGRPLADIARDADEALSFARRTKLPGMEDVFLAQRAFPALLRDEPTAFGERSQAAFETHLRAGPGYVTSAREYWSAKLQAVVILADEAQLLATVNDLASVIPSSMSFFERAEYHFFGGIARALLLETCAADERAAHLEALVSHHDQTAAWAARSPSTFAPRAALLAAERARAEDRHWDASRGFDEAIRLFRQLDLVHVEALVLERAARFHARSGLTSLVPPYLRGARDGYLRWGASAKVRRLVETHPELGVAHRAPAGGTIDTTVESIDLAAVLGLSRAVCTELDLDRVVSATMTIAVEHAGASRGALARLVNGQVVPVAEATTGPQGVVVDLAAPDVVLPETVLQYVARTRKSVLLDDTRNPDELTRDRYFSADRARSVLCLPLVDRGNLVGVLYLENAHAYGAFTAARIAVLEHLAAQAATSLEHARLYADARAENRERLAAERRLQRSEAYLAKAQELSSTGSFGWDLATGAMTWSAETRRLLGHADGVTPSYEAVLARVHPEDVAVFRAVFEANMGAAVDFEHRFVLPDGAVRHMHVVAEPVTDLATGRVELIGAARDITAAKRSEEAMRTMSADLAHVSRIATLGELTASITHEVNQPLSAVRANAQACKRWLEKSPPNVEEAVAAALRIDRDSARASDIVRRMRTLFTKTESSRERVSLDEIARQVLTFTRGELKRDAVLAELVIEADDDGLVVEADPVQLQQVLLNLVLNGRDAMRDVTSHPRSLRVGVWRRGAEVGVDVADAGTGIAAGIAANLFHAFHTTKKEGMGLGLSISRTIIEAHEGRIWATSNTGRPGATFHCALPAARTHSNAATVGVTSGP